MTGSRAAVLGSPIGHSLSPVLHRAAYQRLGLTGRSYDAFDVDEVALPGFLDRIDAAVWCGLSLTMPLKRAVIPLLAEVSEVALAVEAVNTVLFAEDGTRRGENTDVPGIVAALAERGITGADAAAVLGGGATAASAIAALASIVHGGPVHVYVRTPSRAEQLIQTAERSGIELYVNPWTQVGESLEAPLVVNTTPKGAADELVESVTKPVGTLFDVLYHPWPTPLAAAWERAGGVVLGGLDLLIHQAALQVELMTGAESTQRPAVVAAMRAAGVAALNER
ncbi:MAG TPA: shikimate dehydrogenase [Actinocrinis sp.]|uniref:shikimate dehydrogenase n=1 Tax=Actinocrinis sp. TaxID=1920516 RepID=UPI002DDD11E8|nr:shikimate dehydrogenase [Actinocrinis sp.]HEV2344758.1 shikimate dehydrogenase [Actinocrinis sp.]